MGDFKPKRSGLRIFLAGLVVGAVLALVVAANVDSIRQWSLRQLGQSVQAEAKAQQSEKKTTSRPSATPWPAPGGNQ